MKFGMFAYARQPSPPEFSGRAVCFSTAVTICGICREGDMICCCISTFPVNEYDMTFTESITTCLSKYATFRGVASRSEYWWFFLFLVVTSWALGLVSDALVYIFNLAMLLPSLAAGVRRLHDTNRSGWWLLMWLIPFIGWICVVVLLVEKSSPSRYDF